MKKIIFKDEPDETTPLEAEVLNKISNYSIEKKAELSTTDEIMQNTDFVIPIFYKVGDDVLSIFYQGCKLIKDVHYVEIGNVDSISDRIQLKDWSAPSGKNFEFITKGEWI